MFFLPTWLSNSCISNKKMEFYVVKKVLIHPISLLSFSVTSGPGRRPSQTVIEQLKATNKSLKLGQRLCRSRSPDFLLEIIQRQVRKFSLDRRWPSTIGVVFIWIPYLKKNVVKPLTATATLHRRPSYRLPKVYQIFKMAKI